MRRGGLLFMLLVVALSHCDKNKDDAVAGSGVQARKTRAVPPFSRLWVGNVLEVRVAVGKDAPMELKGDDNLLDHVTARLENGVLRLDTDTKIRKKMPLEVTLGTARLEAVDAVVASKVDVRGLSAKDFTVRAAGAARITVEGTAETLTLTSKGAARLDFTKVAAASAKVVLEMGSSARLGYLEKLDATLSGASTVYYQGDPEIVRSVQKPARLIRMEPGR